MIKFLLLLILVGPFNYLVILADRSIYRVPMILAVVGFYGTIAFSRWHFLTFGKRIR